MGSIWIIDFGSQYTFLIAKRIRELNIFCEIFPLNQLEAYIGQVPNAVILSGGPQSVSGLDLNDNADNGNNVNLKLLISLLLNPEIPILGICYGHQLIAKIFDSHIEKSEKGEFGKTSMVIKKNHPLTADISKKTVVWMSHHDIVAKMPRGFKTLAKTSNSKIAAAANDHLNIYTFQFHPEVTHTKKGKTWLKNFVFNIAKLKPNWTTKSKLETCNDYLSKIIKDENDQHLIILGLSGGIDSMTTATLLQNFIKQSKKVITLKCVYIDHGFMREKETEEIKLICAELGINVDCIDASDRFLKRLEDIRDPETKRKIIGDQFIKEFITFVETLEYDNKITKFYLAQGTIYPDVVESAQAQGCNQDVIKSHHNVGGLPEWFFEKVEQNWNIIEPLRNFFKNEVRKLAKTLGIPKIIRERHPFPGPGLAIRILGDINQDKIKIIQKADAIFIDYLKRNKYYYNVSQAYAALLEGKSVGVVGDQRRHGFIICLRAIVTEDFMTAKTANISINDLQKISTLIINSIENVSRVVYDITSKPPATIELE